MPSRSTPAQTTFYELSAPDWVYPVFLYLFLVWNTKNNRVVGVMMSRPLVKRGMRRSPSVVFTMQIIERPRNSHPTGRHGMWSATTHYTFVGNKRTNHIHFRLPLRKYSEECLIKKLIEGLSTYFVAKNWAWLRLSTSFIQYHLEVAKIQ